MANWNGYTWSSQSFPQNACTTGQSVKLPDVSATIASLSLQKPPSSSVRRLASLESGDDIPPYFDVPWSKSDVILRCHRMELHANKAVLSVFSPYFDALFSGRFADKDVNSVEVNCGYDVMQEVLRNIHQVDCSYKENGQRQYDDEMLKELYKIGDFYNFSHIRRLCLDQMTERPSIEMAFVAASLGLQDTLLDILKHLSVPDVKLFLMYEDEYFFTKAEIVTLFEIVAGRPLPTGATDPSANRLNLEEIDIELQNPRIDLTKPWETSDVAISTKNSMGRLLYASQSVINMVSNKFKNLTFTPLLLEKEGRSISLTSVDAEFTTMKEILSVLHHCDTNYNGSPRLLHPALLHSIYRAASEDQLDIRMIRDWCVAQLLKQTSVDSLDVFADLNISLENCTLPISQWRDWILREDGHFSYRKGEEVVVVTPPQNDPRFVGTFVVWLIEQFTTSTLPNIPQVDAYLY